MIPHVNLTDSKISWIGEFPEHWSLKRINDLATVSYGHPFDSAKFNADIGTPLVRIRDISSNSTDIRFDGDVPNYSLIGNGDILVGMDGDFNTAWWQGGTAALNQRVALVRAADEITQRFIYYALPFNLKVINDITFYTTVKHLSGEDIKKTLISIPHDDERKAVVSYLDQETARIDALISEKQNFIDRLKEKRQAMISHFVTKGLDANVPMKDSGVEWIGEVPEHWEIKKVKYLFRMIVDPAPENNDEELLSIYTDIGVKPRKELEQKGNKASTTDGYWRVRKGDIIVNKLLAWMGAIGVSEYDGVTSPAYDILRPLEGTNSRYYSALFRLPICSQELKRYSRGIMEMRLRLYFDKFGQIFVPVPPIDEQIEIQEALDRETARIDELFTAVSESIELLKEHRTALISAAVTGKIDVRNYNKTEAV